MAYKKHLLLLALLPAATFAQQQANLIRAEEIKAQMYFLAGDELQGRSAGSLGAHVAADYIASEFMRLGLKPMGDNGTYFQNFETVRAWLDEETSELRLRRDGIEKSFQIGHDFKLGWLPQSNAPTEVTASVVFLGYGVNAPEYGYNDFAGVDVRGKIALVLDREPQASDPNSKFKGKWDTFHSYAWSKVEQVRKAGAVGLLVIGARVPRRPERIPSAPADYELPGPRYGQGLTTRLWDLPAFTITEETANELLTGSGQTVEKLQQSIDHDFRPHSFPVSGVKVKMRKALRDREVLKVRNVAGMLEGSDPKLKDEVVVITSHHDHGGIIGGRIYPGADDNASGTVAVLQIAQAFVRGNVRPRRSILFISFDAEERGLLGSFYYIDHPLFPLEKTVANLNMDMIGRDEDSATWKTTAEQNRNGVNIVGTLYNPELRRIIEESDKGIGLKLDFKTDSDDPESWFARSDHFPFAVKSIPMVLFNTGEHPDYHTENDTWDRINYPKMEKIVRLVFLTGVQVANSSERIRFNP